MRFGFLLVLVLSVGLVSGISVCIDNVAPSPPLELGVSGNVGSILLEWGAATDEPSCSGIDEYVISREGNEIGRVDGDVLTFVDNDSLGYGEYVYSVYAVDLIGHNTGSSIANKISRSGGGGGSSGGSSSSSYVCSEDWECDAWTDCAGNEKKRECSDLNKCGTNSSKPDTYQDCGVTFGSNNMTLESDIEEPEPSAIVRAFSAITGAVVGGGATSIGIGGLFLVLVIGGFLVVRKRRKKFLFR